MNGSTISSIISQLQDLTQSKTRNEMVRKSNLSEKWMRLLQRYAIEHRSELIYLITERFNPTTKLSLDVNEVRRCIKRMNMSSCIDVQKPF